MEEGKYFPEATTNEAISLQRQNISLPPSTAMSNPTTKKRKIRHVSSNGGIGDDGAASPMADPFEDSIYPWRSSSHELTMAHDDSKEEMEGLNDVSERMKSSNQGRTRVGAPGKTGNRKTQENSQGIFQGGVYSGEVYKSNLFKLQLDELLQQVKPNLSKMDMSIATLLRTLKTLIENLPNRDPVSIPEAEKMLSKSDGIILPFSRPKPALDPNYKLHYVKPTQINSVGSYPLNVMTKTGDGLVLDLVVNMPSSIFQEKDFLNHRYFCKRAYYLACLAAGIKSNKTHSFKLKFEHLHGNRLLPVLVVQPAASSTSLPCRIIIIPAISKGVFPIEKLSPTKNCVRPGTDESNKDSSKIQLEPTPFYNSSVLVDSLVTSFLKLQYSSAKDSEAYRDACILGRVWLKQRGFGGNIEKGGFGNFEWAILTALLLQGGGPKGLPAFSRGYSSYQLFKATLQYIATKDLAKNPQVINEDSSQVKLNRDGRPQFFDALRGLNILYKMTPWSYRLLQYEARSTMAALSDSLFDQFEATFIMKIDQPMCRYDAILDIPYSVLFTEDIRRNNFDIRLEKHCNELYSVLSRALGDRIKLLCIHTPEKQSWPVDSKVPLSSPSVSVMIGFVFDPNNIHRAVDHGPAAEDKASAADFRRFWGDRSELRRFKDGSIRESIVWSNEGVSESIFQRISAFVLSRHFGEPLARGITYICDREGQLLPHAHAKLQANATSFQPINTAFKALENDIRALEGLPLHIRHVLAADSALSSTSVDIPFSPPQIKMTRFADVVIQFEGSTRWPDDMDAIQRTKIAFLHKLGELLEGAVEGLITRVGLENESTPHVNQSYLDVIYPSSASFRLRIHHDREATLLERQLKDKSISQQDKIDIAAALATYKRDYLRNTAHTQALQTLATRFSTFSATARLVKVWFAHHRLSLQFPSALIDLFVARSFVNPHPWPAPSSPNTGLVRTLTLLSRWDWRNEPWIVDLSGGNMKASDTSSIYTRFDAWRKIDPGLNRVVLFAASNVDPDGITWTDHGRPARVVALRMSALAKASVNMVQEESLRLDFKSLFTSSPGDYDVLVRLDSRFAKDMVHGKINPSEFKNLKLQTSADADTAGYSPIHLFIKELEELYGQAMIFFFDECKADVIAALWNPQCQRPWKLKLGYSTVPVAGKSGMMDSSNDRMTEELFDINKAAILSEIARLGGAMITTIEAR